MTLLDWSCRTENSAVIHDEYIYEEAVIKCPGAEAKQAVDCADMDKT